MQKPEYQSQKLHVQVLLEILKMFWLLQSWDVFLYVLDCSRFTPLFRSYILLVVRSQSNLNHVKPSLGKARFDAVWSKHIGLGRWKSTDPERERERFRSWCSKSASTFSMISKAEVSCCAHIISTCTFGSPYQHFQTCELRLYEGVIKCGMGVHVIRTE